MTRAVRHRTGHVSARRPDTRPDNGADIQRPVSRVLCPAEAGAMPARRTPVTDLQRRYDPSPLIEPVGPSGTRDSRTKSDTNISVGLCPAVRGHEPLSAPRTQSLSVTEIRAENAPGTGDSLTQPDTTGFVGLCQRVTASRTPDQCPSRLQNATAKSAGARPEKFGDSTPRPRFPREEETPS